MKLLAIPLCHQKNGGQAAGYSHLTDGTTDMTTSHLTDETTSHSTRLSKDYSQVAGYNPAKGAGQVIDETTSHLTKAASCQVIGYGYSHSTRLPAEELLAGHPKDGSQVAGYKLANALHSHSATSPKDGDISRWLTPTKSLVNAGQVIDETTSHLTKAASCQVIGYGYS